LLFYLFRYNAIELPRFTLTFGFVRRSGGYSTKSNDEFFYLFYATLILFITFWTEHICVLA